MCTKKFCNYDNYYLDQAGGNLDISYYRGYPYQRGYGRFSSFAKKYGIPALKYLLKQGIEFGKDVYGHFREGKPVREAIKHGLKSRAGQTLKDLHEQVTQSGSGLRKKPRFKINKKSKQKPKRRKQVKSSKRFKKKRKTNKKQNYTSDIFS